MWTEMEMGKWQAANTNGDVASRGNPLQNYA
jgi:hypothetical protein